MMLVQLAPAPRWQRFEAGRLVAAGSGWPAMAAEPVTVAIPGEAVALHWLDLPALAPAQASAAARLMLGDQLSESDPHLVVASGAGKRPVAVVARTAMAGWLAELAAHELVPAALVPEPLLLPAPDIGWAVQRDDTRVIARSAEAGFAAEADLAALLIGDAPTRPGTLTPADPAPLNLLCGDFAPATRWQPPAGLARRAAVMAVALAGLWLAGDVAALLRAQAAARAADAEVMALARPLLPAGAENGTAALAQLRSLARQRGADGGLAALAAPLTTALAAQQAAGTGAGLASLSYTPAGGLVAGIAGGEAEARVLAEALAAAGLTARAGLPRATADGTITEVTVQAPGAQRQ
jgi:general secretion pathway protein L